MHPLKKTGLFWFRHDLRLTDNLALLDLNQRVDQLLCVFVIPPSWFEPNAFGFVSMGEARKQFLLESLQDLNNGLAHLGHELLVFQEEPVACLERLIDQYQVDELASGFHPGLDEQQQWEKIQGRCPKVVFSQTENYTLFDTAALPFPVQRLPGHFTPFRKIVEAVSVPSPVGSVEALKPMVGGVVGEQDSGIFQLEKSTSPFLGGASSGQAQLRRYLFDTHLIKTYKQTRNGLDGWDYSSKLSPWLALGCLSVRQVYQDILSYEAQHGENQSTYWLRFELLWREYFQWYLICHRQQLFRFAGVQNTPPNTRAEPNVIASWCAGNTPYPIVNACMNQLNQTGFMSNRGRQWVASCLVWELQTDWRYGAAYFEQQLLDFDVASNWGNWQYLAGVGADPRGHRRFDLEKQAGIYDPDGDFVSNWT